MNHEINENGKPEIENETRNGKCPECGAEMVFSPEKSALECPYCGNTVAVDFSQTSKERDFSELFNVADKWGGETHVFRCNNCGAKEVLSKNEIAKVCPFCGTTNIVVTDELSGLKPNGIVPFAIDKKTAAAKVKTWAKRKLYAPRAFKKSVTPEGIAGTYNPAFTFDADAFVVYRGVLGKHYTVTRTVNGKTVTETRTRYFNIGGTFDMRFDDILIQASEKISQRDINKLRPFDTNESNEYSTEFLHGFSAQQYEKSGEECWTEARRLIEQIVKSRILAKYDYDVIQSYSQRVETNNVTYKYLLLPIYVGHCKWKKKLYNFFVNGHNGNVTGKTPVSAVKVLITVLIGLGIVVGLGLLFYYLFSGT